MVFIFSIQKKLTTNKKTIHSSSTGIFQRVLLNDQISEWLPVRASVLKGFLLLVYTLSFFFYINNIYKKLTHNT